MKLGNTKTWCGNFDWKGRDTSTSRCIKAFLKHTSIFVYQWCGIQQLIEELNSKSCSGHCIREQIRLGAVWETQYESYRENYGCPSGFTRFTVPLHSSFSSRNSRWNGPFWKHWNSKVRKAKWVGWALLSQIVTWNGATKSQGMNFDQCDVQLQSSRNITIFPASENQGWKYTFNNVFNCLHKQK